METEKIIEDPIYDTKERLRRLEVQVKRVADGIDAMREKQEHRKGIDVPKFVRWITKELAREVEDYFKTFGL